jgi:hypothetical protein
MTKDEAEFILNCIKDLEVINVSVSSRYGGHEATKKYLKSYAERVGNESRT